MHSILEHRNSEKEKTKVPKTKLISRVRKKNPDYYPSNGHSRAPYESVFTRLLNLGTRSDETYRGHEESLGRESCWHNLSGQVRVKLGPNMINHSASRPESAL